MHVKNNLLTESPQLKWGVTKNMILKQHEKPATARTHCRKRDSRTSHTSPPISTRSSSAHVEPVSTGVENDQSTTVTCALHQSRHPLKSEAPWYAIQSTVTLIYEFRSFYSAAITQAVNPLLITLSTHDTFASWTWDLLLVSIWLTVICTWMGLSG